MSAAVCGRARRSATCRTPAEPPRWSGMNPGDRPRHPGRRGKPTLGLHRCPSRISRCSRRGRQAPTRWPRVRNVQERDSATPPVPTSTRPTEVGSELQRRMKRISFACALAKAVVVLLLSPEGRTWRSSSRASREFRRAGGDVLRQAGFRCGNQSVQTCPLLYGTVAHLRGVRLRPAGAAYSARHSPDLPPRLCSRRTPSTRIARSTALHMS